MLKPQFLLTKTVPVTILRRVAGTYVDGRWVEGTTTEIPIEANIQPIKDSELMLMPEADRSREWYKGYTASLVRTQKEGVGGYDADEFDWQGDRYKIMKVRNYAMGTLDHFRFIAARIELSPN